MNEIDFRNLVRQMLDAQQTYFKKGRKPSDLQKSIQLEAIVRQELEAGPDGSTLNQQLPLIEEIPARRFSQFE
jgi:hypothetical protein